MDSSFSETLEKIRHQVEQLNTEEKILTSRATSVNVE